MTLIELLVTLVITSILLSLVYSSLQNGNTLVTKLLHRADDADRYSATVRLLRRQLEHVALVETLDKRSRRMLRFRGLPGDLSFVAPLPMYSSSDALYAIRFYYRNNALYLSFIADGDSEENTEQMELLDDLEYFEIEYLGDQEQWLSHWLHKSQLPRAVRIRLLRVSTQSTEHLYLPLRLHGGAKV